MKNTVKSHTDMERIFSQGKRVSYPCVTILALPSSSNSSCSQGRCGFVAGKKLGSAPLRSRSKRVMREAASQLGAPWQGFDVVFVARQATATASHEQLVRDCRRALTKLEIENLGGPYEAK